LVIIETETVKVSGDEELYGLDIALHKTMAYPEDMMEEN
jgi:ammonia channel protein AmtB